MIRQTLFTLAISTLFIATAHAERVPLTADQPPPSFQEATPYVLPKPGTAEAERNPYAKPDAPPALTYDLTTGLYTYWDTAAGERRTMSFDLPSRVRASIAARVEPNADRSEFTYVYTIRNLPDSPQELRLVVFEVDPSAIEKITTDEGWRSVASGPVKRVMIYSRMGPVGLASGKGVSVRLQSRQAPRLVDVLAQGWNRRPRFPPDVAPKYPGISLRDQSVRGLTVGPGSRPLVAPLDALREVITTAGTWGWISKAMEKDILDRLDRFPGSGKTLREFLKEVDTTAGRVAPEVHAMIQEILHNL